MGDRPGVRGKGPRAVSSRVSGQWAEARAVSFLEAEGLRIVDRNIVAGGVELDIVAEATDSTGSPIVVFVEVRSRGSADRGHPVETIRTEKQRRLVRGAASWLVERGLYEKVPVRFDVVTVVGRAAGDGSSLDPPPEIAWLRSAFESDG